MQLGHNNIGFDPTKKYTSNKSAWNIILQKINIPILLLPNEYAVFTIIYSAFKKTLYSVK